MKSGAFNKVVTGFALSSSVFSVSPQLLVLVNKEIEKAFSGIFGNFNVITRYAVFPEVVININTRKKMNYNYSEEWLLKNLIDLKLLENVPIEKLDAYQVLSCGRDKSEMSTICEDINGAVKIFLTLKYTSGKKNLKANTKGLEGLTLLNFINRSFRFSEEVEVGEEHGGWYVQIEGFDEENKSKFIYDSSYLNSSSKVLPFLNLLIKNAGVKGSWIIKFLDGSYYLTSGARRYNLGDGKLKDEDIPKIRKIFGKVDSNLEIGKKIESNINSINFIDQE